MYNLAYTYDPDPQNAEAMYSWLPALAAFSNHFSPSSAASRLRARGFMLDAPKYDLSPKTQKL